MSDLDKLIKAVEGGPAAPVEGVFEFATRDQAQWAAKAYNGDLNAAKRLHEALLPGWFPGVSQNIHHGHWCAWVQDKVQFHYDAKAATPARAWLLAILKAVRAQAAP